MRIFVAGISTETNTFSTIPTSLQDFEDAAIVRPGEHPDYFLEFAAPLWAAREYSKSKICEIVEGTFAVAFPAGITTRIAYESLRDAILEQLKNAMPVDVIALGMHGAMIADGYPDCEGDMLKHVRSVVGKRVTIGLEIDPHCHLTKMMTRNADLIIAYKEYPHIDTLERAEELINILEKIHKNIVQPTISVYDCKMLSVFHTTKEPMSGFIQKIKELEQQEDILSISIIHGFPWADVENIGAKILVVTNNQKEKGDVLAEVLGKELFTLRGETFTTPLCLKDAINIIQKRTDKKPLLVADISDNPGGGAAGDSTFILEALLKSEVTKTCLGPLWDPMAVRIAFSAGIGAKLNMRIGGKMGPASGNPLDAQVEIIALCKNAKQNFSGSSIDIGDCAAIRIDGVDVVLSTIRCQALAPDLFTNLYINPEKYRIIVVKSSEHFKHEFESISVDIIYVNTPGTLTMDFSSIPYTKIDRQLWYMEQHN